MLLWMADKVKVVVDKMSTTNAVPLSASPVPIGKSADLEMDGREDFQKSLCLWAAALKQIRLLKGCRSHRFLRFGYYPQAERDGKASAEAAYPLAEPTVLCSRRMKVS